VLVWQRAEHSCLRLPPSTASKILPGTGGKDCPATMLSHSLDPPPCRTSTGTYRIVLLSAWFEMATVLFSIVNLLINRKEISQ